MKIIERHNCLSLVIIILYLSIVCNRAGKWVSSKSGRWRCIEGGEKGRDGGVRCQKNPMDFTKCRFRCADQTENWKLEFVNSSSYGAKLGKG